MKTFKINAEGERFTGKYTLVMTWEDGIPIPIGVIIASNTREKKVQARFLADGFTQNNEEFASKAAAERAIIANYSNI